MDSWGSTREVEKPKPIKLRAGEVATRLVIAQEALLIIFGHQQRQRLAIMDTIAEAIDVLSLVAGEKPKP